MILTNEFKFNIESIKLLNLDLNIIIILLIIHCHKFENVIIICLSFNLF